MDIEAPESPELDTVLKSQSTGNFRTILIDDVEVMPADKKAKVFHLTLNESLKTINMLEFMKLCLNSTFNFCVDCNYARKILVDSKSLAIHFITTHRFHTTFDEVEVMENDKILDKFEQMLSYMNGCCFNLQKIETCKSSASKSAFTPAFQTLQSQTTSESLEEFNFSEKVFYGFSSIFFCYITPNKIYEKPVCTYLYLSLGLYDR